LWAFIAEVAIILFLSYVPGLNNFLLLDVIESEHACVGLWMIPVIIFNEEVRKACIRKWPEGIISRVTNF
jgi:hypothetical protein